VTAGLRGDLMTRIVRAAIGGTSRRLERRDRPRIRSARAEVTKIPPVRRRATGGWANPARSSIPAQPHRERSAADVD
jgi:hypothetical protein